MRALRRLFGDVVLEVFPPELIEAVDAAYKFWQEHPDSYLITAFDDAGSKEDSLTAMRAYAECAGEAGYTIRTLSDPDPLRLVWRAQTRKTIKDD